MRGTVKCLILLICGIYIITEIRGLPVDDYTYSYYEEEISDSGLQEDLPDVPGDKGGHDSGEESQENSLKEGVWYHDVANPRKDSRVKSLAEEVRRNMRNTLSNVIRHIKTRKKRDASNSGEDMTEQDCKEYLYKYGYLKKNDTGNDDEVKDALVSFQSFVKIDKTGECDNKTKEKMSKPRCGFPDKVDNNGNDANNRYAINSAHRWYKNTLTYWYENFTPDLSEANVKSQMEGAYKVWADVTPLSFCEVSTSTDANMEILFAAGDHGDGGPFDGEGSTLAHAFIPVDQGLPMNTMSGHIHFDEDEKWSTLNSNVNLLQVAAHEIGHALGLYHTNITGALMWPYYAYDASFSLPSDDIAAIQALYGGPTGSKEDRVRFNQLRLDITGPALAIPVFNATCPDINELLRTTPLYDPVSCRVESESSSGSGYTASLRISVDTTATNADDLTTDILDVDFPADTLLSDIASSEFAPTSSSCSSGYQAICDKGNADCFPLADGYRCVCPAGLVNIGTIPDVYCVLTRDGEISFAYMRDVTLVIRGGAPSPNDGSAILGQICQDVVTPCLEEYSINALSCGLRWGSISGDWTYTTKYTLVSWVPLTTIDLNRIVTASKISAGIDIFSVSSSAFSATASSCTTEQVTFCDNESTGAECIPIAGGYYCQCPDGQIDVGYGGKLDCILAGSCVKTIEGTTPPTTPTSTSTTTTTPTTTTTTTATSTTTTTPTSTTTTTPTSTSTTTPTSTSTTTSTSTSTTTPTSTTTTTPTSTSTTTPTSTSTTTSTSTSTTTSTSTSTTSPTSTSTTSPTSTSTSASTSTTSMTTTPGTGGGVIIIYRIRFLFVLVRDYDMDGIPELHLILCNLIRIIAESFSITIIRCELIASSSGSTNIETELDIETPFNGNQITPEMLENMFSAEALNAQDRTLGAMSSSIIRSPTGTCSPAQISDCESRGASCVHWPVGQACICPAGMTFRGTSRECAPISASGRSDAVFLGVGLGLTALFIIVLTLVLCCFCQRRWHHWPRVRPWTRAVLPTTDYHQTYLTPGWPPRNQVPLRIHPVVHPNTQYGWQRNNCYAVDLN